MELQQNTAYGRVIDLEQNIGYIQCTGLQLNVSQPMDPELQRDINFVKLQV